MKPDRLLLVALFLFGSANGAVAAGPEDSIVKLTSILRLPNPVRPWTKQNPMEVGGTGVVIDGKRILTMAHLVTYAEEIYVRPGNGGDRVEAKVAAIAPGIDLAVLTIDRSEADFFDKRPPLPRAAALPQVPSPVEVKGFPINVPTLSTARGIVSRIEYAYFDTGSMGLRIPVDAAVNPGNSGGPALVDGKMVGLVWGQAGAENVGYLVANEEVDDFINDIADGRYDGKPSPDEQWQALENEALRARLGLAKSVRGIMVREPKRREASYPLQEFDVVTAIGDKPIDNEGMIQAAGSLRLSFLHLVPGLAPGMDKALRDSDRYDWRPLAPVFLHHGTHDDIVPFFCAQMAYEAMRARGGRVKLYPYLGKDRYQPVNTYLTRSLADFAGAGVAVHTPNLLGSSTGRRKACGARTGSLTTTP
jgi:S1-C subfamily serine protease